MEANVYITLKKVVSDPQGLTVKHALESLGSKEIEEVRVGKLINLKLKINDKAKAEKIIDEACKKLLANPVIEDYRFEIQ